MPRLRTAIAVSAGGVVFRHVSGLLEFIICGRADTGTWGLPKGTPSAGESIDQTALREAREETGLDVIVIAPLTSIEYWFVARRTRFRKTVHFYLMEAVGGDVSRHDHEYDHVVWVTSDEAVARLTYENEKQVARQAIARLTAKLGGEVAI